MGERTPGATQLIHKPELPPPPHLTPGAARCFGHTHTSPLASSCRQQQHPQHQTSATAEMQCPKWFPMMEHHNCSPPTPPWEGTPNPEPPAQSEETQFAFPTCHKTEFSKGKQQKAEQFLISYTLAALLYIAECCSTQWISICKHLPAPPAEQIISASAFGTQTTFFLFHGGKRLQPFDFKHRHPSGLSSRKSVSPRLQIDMFVCRVTLLIRRFSFRHKKCLLVKLQQPIKFQA